MIIDCDPGIDDALAILLALKAGLEIEGITTVHGNVALSQTTANASRLLEFLSVNLPLGRGAESPLVCEPFHASEVHGKDGLGDAKIPYSSRNIFLDGVDFILKRVQSGTRRIVAIGPLTNIALAFRKGSSTMEELEELVMMGGAIAESGNVTERAEFNFFVDPHAADFVLRQNLRKVLIPLDVTRRVSLQPRLLNKLGESRAAELVRMLVKKSIYLHDPLAVGYVLDPSFVSLEGMSLAVATEGSLRGACLPGKGEVEVATSVDGERFLDYFISSIDR